MELHERKNVGDGKAGWILLPEQMDIIKRKPYMYNATAGSFLELLFLQRFWTWLVNYVPLQVAPCSLTCLGLGINLLCCVTLLCYCTDSMNEAPSWTFVLCAVGVFLYQTLDALDGKQAIKVQNTQIEEVYDHGCDAVSTVFLTLCACASCHLANCPLLMFTFFLASILAFYSTHWQDHVTHVMVFRKIDVSEAQFYAICVHLTTAYFGQSVWHIKLLYGVELRHVFVILTILSLLSAIVTNIGYVLGNDTPMDSYVKIARKMGASNWTPAAVAFVLTVFAIQSYCAGLFETSPFLFVVAFGFAYAKITLKLVITNVTSADMDIWDSCLVAPFLLGLNTFVHAIPPYNALLCGLVYNLMDLARYFTYVSWDLREALDIWIFSLKYLPGHPKCRNGNLGYYLNGLNNKDFETLESKRFKMQE